MHKAIDPMNLQIDHVITTLNGKSGTDIVEAIPADLRATAGLAESGGKRLLASKKNCEPRTRAHLSF